MKQNLSSKRKNQSILATSIFDLSPLHETNETEHQTRLSQPGNNKHLTRNSLVVSFGRIVKATHLDYEKRGFI